MFTLLATEKRALAGLSGMFAIRMLGLFLALPVLSLYAGDLPGATPALIGIALGIYGITQAVLQIPFGLLSDRYGRKFMIAIGLVLFLAGSVIAAQAETMNGLILGRALQGAGAVSGVILALLADLTRESVRTPAMALVGLSVALSFGVAMTVSPIIAASHGLSGVFWFTAALALLSLLALWRIVPDAPQAVRHRDVSMDFGMLGSTLARPDLLRLNLSVFVLHFTLMAVFMGVPTLLEQSGTPAARHGWIYLLVITLSVLALIPLMTLAERRNKVRAILLLAIALTTLSTAAMGQFRSHYGVIALLWSFFIGFNLLEAMLPSLLSKLAPAGTKGTAMGAYSTCQFLGTSLGAMLGGRLAQSYGLEAIFLMTAGLGVLWWLLMLGMKEPPRVSAATLRLSRPLAETDIPALQARLQAVAGVREVMLAPGESVAYLKTERGQFQRTEASAALGELAGE